MTDHLGEADRFLLDQIRQGNPVGWQQLVERYQGRLLSFARGKLGRSADAEDLVQETFINLLRGLAQFREEASLETYLFLILRRRIATWARSRGQKLVLLDDMCDASDEESGGLAEPPSPDQTASWYARRGEEHGRHEDALLAAMREVIGEFKSAGDLRDLQIAEMIFYCQARNKNIAQIMGVRDNYIALVKHRLVARLQEYISGKLVVGTPEFELPDAMLQRLWREHRLSCPKRSTIGAYLLGTLDDAWQGYVKFHIEQLECSFCRANLDDMQGAIQDSAPPEFRDRILESTIGFLNSRSEPRLRTCLSEQPQRHKDHKEKQNSILQETLLQTHDSLV